MLVPGFEPGSKPREGFMIGHYTIRACILISEGPYFRTPMRAQDHDHTHQLECELKVNE